MKMKNAEWSGRRGRRSQASQRDASMKNFVLHSISELLRIRHLPIKQSAAAPTATS
ncbi:MAG: hypothetical protein ABSG04_04705 [Verrucomicrobiota bacterium]|jgi:hypothetical protein